MFFFKFKREAKCSLCAISIESQAETSSQAEASSRICSAAAATHTAIDATDILVAPRDAARHPVWPAIISRSGRRQTAWAPVNRHSFLSPRASVAL